MAFERATIDENNRLSVSFEANPLRVRADGYDMVRVYVYSPALGRGYLTAPVYRRSKRIEALLPDEFEGQQVQLYGFVQNDQGMCSYSCYIESTSQQDNESTSLQDGEATSQQDKELPASHLTANYSNYSKLRSPFMISG